MVKGDSIPNFNGTENISKDTKAERKDKKKNKSKKQKPENKAEEPKEEANVVNIPSESLDNFLSAPAAAVLEKLFAQQKTVASLKDLRTLNEAGDIIKISYDSDQEDNIMELKRIEHLEMGDHITTTSLDFEGNILTSTADSDNWVREGSVKTVRIILPTPECFALYQEGRLEKLLKQERYRKQQAAFTDVCRDLLQHILLNKPEKPLIEMREYFKQLKAEKIF